jgi:hypothetical protein
LRDPGTLSSSTVVRSRRGPLLVAVTLAVVMALGAVVVAQAGRDDDPGDTPLGSTSPSSEAPGTATSEGESTPGTGESINPNETTTSALRTTTTTTRPAPVALSVAGATASVTAPDGFDACTTITSFGAANAVDGYGDTAWRAEGDGTGHWLRFDLGGERRVLTVGLLPGYDKIDPCDGTDRWAQSRRPTRVTWLFDDGTSVSQELVDTPEMQTVPVDATSRFVELRIDGVTADPARDFTAISEVTIQGR